MAAVAITAVAIEAVAKKVTAVTANTHTTDWIK
jgi:hypothetical protein